LSDAQWQRIELMLRPEQRIDGRGRSWQDTRAVLNGVLWILGTGAQWRELPNKYPPYQTCHRRFQLWVRQGKLEQVLRGLAEELHSRGKLRLDAAFIDASFTGAKKGASRWADRCGVTTNVGAWNAFAWLHHFRSGHALGISHREFLWDGPPRLHQNPIAPPMIRQIVAFSPVKNLVVTRLRHMIFALPFLLLLANLGLRQTASLPNTQSPAIFSLEQQVSSGHTTVVDEFWSQFAKQHSPMVESDPTDPNYSFVTFVWRGSSDTRNVVVISPLALVNFDEALWRGWRKPTFGSNLPYAQ
jgi:transposase